jgi:hypothetical protein
VLQLLSYSIHAIQPFLVPICFVSAWAILLMTIGNIWGTVSVGVSRAKQMHQVPCANCLFFTNDHRLKCPVNPTIAMSEEAIGCLDYRSRSGN